jgi:hypothetical protein
MECYFCKKDENEIINILTPVIKKIEEKISKLDTQIDIIKEKYTKEFSNENIEKVKKINKNLLNIKINAFLDNLEPFLNMDNNLQLLKIYFEKYNPNISKGDILGNLVNLYILEPTEIRLNNALNQYIQERNNLFGYVEEIKSKNKLIEVKDVLDIFLIVFDFTEKLEYEIIDDLKVFQNIPKDKSIFLCPYCLYLYDESISKIKEIKKNISKIPINLQQSNGPIQDWDFEK